MGVARRLAPVTTAFRRALAKVQADEAGVAAVEFGLVLPFMLLVYIGTSAITSAISADRSVVVLARTLADVTAQQAANVALTDTTAQNIFMASTAIMAPYPTTGLKMTLSNVEFVANASATGSNKLDAKTRWTVTFSGGTLRPCGSAPQLTPVANGTAPSPRTMPLGLYTAGFLIVADVTYVYTPGFGFFTYNFATGTVGSPLVSYTMSATDYMRPRQTDNIRYASGQTAQICSITSPQTASLPPAPQRLG